MNKGTFIFTFLLLSLFSFSQRNFSGKIDKDIFGNLNYTRNDGFKATLSENIFDDVVYEDTNKNKLIYKKKFLDRIQEDGDRTMFYDLLRYFSDKVGLEEEFEVDILDKMIYKNNKGFKATFSKNIFDDVEYEDTNSNKIVYKQKFLELLDLSHLENLDAHLFMDILDFMIKRTNFQEKYEVDIFDKVKYSNSERSQVEIDSREARRMYNRTKRGDRDLLWGDFF